MPHCVVHMRSVLLNVLVLVALSHASLVWNPEGLSITSQQSNASLSLKCGGSSVDLCQRILFLESFHLLII